MDRLIYRGDDMSYGISREQEAQLPQFKSHDEARAYFKNLYGNKFVMMDSIEDSEGKIYLYDLKLDNDFPFDKQRIEISEDGYIHIIH